MKQIYVLAIFCFLAEMALSFSVTNDFSCDLVIASVTSTNPTHCDSTNGVIVVVATSSSTIEYSIDSGSTYQSSGIFNNLTHGTYYVLVRDLADCHESYTANPVILTAPFAPFVNGYTTVADSDCSLGNGSINISATGGISPLEYSIDDGSSWQTQSSFTALNSGDYISFVRNTGGTCITFVDTITVEDNEPPVFSNIQVQDAICGASVGSIIITVTGGPPSKEYSIDNGGSWQSSNTFTGLPAGDYNIRVRIIETPCARTFEFNPVTIYSTEVNLDSVQSTNITGCNNSDGTITVFASGMLGGYQYSIDGGSTYQSSNIFTGLTAGAYDVIVRNFDGTCDSSYVGNPVILTDAFTPTFTSLFANPISDCFLTDGAINISASGASTIEYSIDSGSTYQSTSSFSNLSPDSFYVFIRYTDGTCATPYPSNPVYVDDLVVPTFTSFSATNPSPCGGVDGTINVTATADGTLEYSIDSGSTYQSFGSFSGLSAGTYHVMTRYLDVVCEVPYSGNPVILTASAPISIDAVASTDPTDCSVNDGTITISASGGIGSFLYSIDSGSTYQTSGSFSGLMAGQYNIRVKNTDNSCDTTYTGNPVILLVPAAPTITSVTSTDPTSCGSGDGNITINATGSSIEYSIDGGFNWQISNSFFGLDAGTYNVAVRNTDGTCLILDVNNPLIVTAPGAPVITNVSSTDPTECSIADGTITITATGGVGSYEYSIDSGSTWVSTGGGFGGLAGGLYHVFARNSDGSCQVVGPPTVITDKVEPIITDVTLSDPTSCGATDGSISITATGIGSLEYSIDGGLNWQPVKDFTGLTSATYNITIRNSDGTCFVSYPTVFLNDGPIPITGVSANDPSNCLVVDGNIIINAIASPSVEYSIDGGTTFQPSNTFVGLAGGSYNVVIQNNDGTCNTFYSGNPVALISPAEITINTVNSSDVTDCGANDGTISISAMGGTGTLEYSVDSGSTYQSSNNFTSLSVGNYYAFVRYVGGTCDTAYTGNPIVITEPFSSVITSVNNTDPTDCGLNDGTITIISTGSTVEYSINGGLNWQPSNNFTNLSASNYSIAIRNTDGTCQINGSTITLTAPSSPVITSVNSTNPTDCGLNDGTITVSATGGSGSLEYSNDGGLNWQPTGSFTGLAAGNYNILVRNTDGTCEVINPSNPVTLTAPSSPTITSVNPTDPTDCGLNDGTIVVNATGGSGSLEYSNDGGTTFQLSNVFSGLAGGSYQISVRNTDGTCEITSSPVTLQDKIAPVITSVNASDPTDCGLNDGTITITASGSGALEYSIFGGSTYQLSNTFVGLSGGTYDIRVRNVDGTCEVTAPSVTLNAPILPTITSVNASNPSDCGVNDGSIIINATGSSIEYSIDGGLNWQPAGSFTGLAAGTYNVFVRNIDGTCTVTNPTNPVTLTAPSSPVITNVNSTNPTDCGLNDGTITVSATGGSGSLEYSNDGGTTFQPSNVFSGLSGGSYQIQVRNTDGTCIVSAPDVTLTDKIPPTIISISPTDPSSCIGTPNGIIEITANGSGGVLEYSQNGGSSWQSSNVITGLSCGNYSVAVRYTDGTCEVSGGTITLPTTVNTPPIARNDTIGTTSGSSVSGFVLNNDIDPEGNNILISTTPVTLPLGGTVTINANGSYVFISSGGYIGVDSFQYEICDDGMPSLCDTATVLINIICDINILNVVNTDISNCGLTDAAIVISATSSGGSISYSIDSGVTYQPSNVFTALDSGTYYVFVQETSSGCVTQGSIVMIEGKVPPIISSVITNDPTDCGIADGIISISAGSSVGNALEYSNDGGITWQTSNVFLGLSGGTYSIRVRNADGTCEVSDANVTLVNPIPPVISNVTSSDPTDCNVNDGTITITASGSISIEYSIDGGINWQISNSFTGLSSGTYNVATRNVDGTCLTLDTSNPLILTAPTAPIITNVASTNPTDCGNADGTIIISATSGSGSYEYSINGGINYQPSSVFTGLNGGAYNISIRNNDGTCAVVGPITIIEDKVAPVINSVTTTNPSDCGISDGTITISATSSAGNTLQYSHDGGVTWQASNLFVGLSGGTYLIRVRNIDGTCEVSSVDEVLINPVLPVINNVVTTNPSDCSTNDGTITITATGVSLEYSVDGGLNWQLSNSFTNLPEGIYNVAVRNPDGTCLVLNVGNPHVLVAPAFPTITNVSSTDPTDCGINDGTITINAIGGSGSLEYSINGGLNFQPSNIFTGLAGGAYSIIVQNGDGTCQITGPTVIVEDKVAPTIASVTSTDPTDCGVADGTITISANSSAGNTLEYSINNGLNFQPSNIFTGLIGGSYSIRVRNIDGTCVVSATDVVLNDLVAPVISSVATSNPTDCNINDGTITITASSSVLEYSIDGGFNWQISNIFSGLSSGSYNVAIRNTDGSCQILDSGNPHILTAPMAPAITSVIGSNPTDCGLTDGTISISAVGGSGTYGYSIDSGSTFQSSGIFTGLSGGMYYVFVRNNDGTCQVMGQTTILTDKILPTITGVSSTDPTNCGVTDGTISISASSGASSILEYSIDGGSTWQVSSVFFGLSGGSYPIRVRNIDGTCEVTTLNQTLTDKVAPIITSVATTDPTDCGAADGTITITATGTALEYSIDGGLNWQSSNVFNSLAVSAYYVTVRNADGSCFTPDGNNPYLINPPVAPSLTSIISSDPTDCGVSDGTITVTAIAGSTSVEYSSDGGSTWQSTGAFTGLSGGTYFVHVRNADGTCEVAGLAVTLTDKVLPTIDNISVTNTTTCSLNDGGIQITASGSGAIEYSIDGGTTWQFSNNFANLACGIYQPSIRYVDGTCEVPSTNVTVSETCTATIDSLNPSIPTNCTTSDGTLEIFTTSSSTLEYSIDNGASWQSTNIFSGLSNGFYNIAIQETSTSCITYYDNNPVEFRVNCPPISVNDTSFVIQNGVLNGNVLTNVSDPDGNDTLKVIVPTFLPPANGALTIDTTGDFTYTPNTNFTGIDTFGYIVCDDGSMNFGGEMCDTGYVFIEVANPSTPVIISDVVDSLTENTLLIGLIVATDADAGDMITYEIVGGDDAGFFTINSQTGLLTFINAPDYENPQDANTDNIYLVDVAASDLSGNSDTASFTIYVLNTNDGTGAPIFVMTTDSIETLEGYIEIAPILAQDADTNDVFFFHITGGVDSQFFDIDTVSGELSFDTPPNFDTPLDFDNNNIYEVKIEVVDTGGLFNERLFFIEVKSCGELYFVDSYLQNDVTICDGSNGLIGMFGNTNAPLPIEYSIDGGTTWANQNLFLNLSAGTYPTAIRSNDNVCVLNQDTITISGLASPIIDSISTIDTDCGDTTGVIQIHGISDFEYSIDAGATWNSDSTFNNLNGGGYIVAIRNTDGTCPTVPSTLNPVVIQTAPFPTISQVNSSDPTDCNLIDGAIEITASSGSGSYIYSIDNGLTYQNTGTFTGLAGDSTYQVLIANDDTTCLVTGQSITLLDKISPVIDSVPFTNPTDCNLTTPNGSITIFANGNGPLQYSIDSGLTWQPSNVFIQLSEAVYHVFVRNGLDSSCVVDPNISISIVEPQPPIIDNILVTDNTDCGANDGTITINATSQTGQQIEYSINGGANYQASNVFTGLQVNSNYNAVIRYVGGTCGQGYVNNPLIVSQPSSPFINNINATNPTDCGQSDGVIVVTASGGTAPLEYGISTNTGIQWQNQNGIFNNLGSDVYTMYVRNADSTCLVTSSPVPIDTLAPGVITGFVSNGPGNCASNDGFIILSATANSPSSIIEYSIDSGLTWSTDSIFNSLAAGDYHVKIRVDGGCETNFGNLVTLFPNSTDMIAVVQPISPTDCDLADGAINILPFTGLTNLQYSINGGLDGTWQDNGFFDNLSVGQYVIAVRTLNGGFNCIDYDTTIIELPDTAAAQIFVSNVSCHGGSDGYVVVYSDTQQDTIGNLGIGTLRISSSQLGGCASDSIITLTEPTPLVASMRVTPVNEDVSLNSGEADVFVQGGTPPYNFTWSSGGTNRIASSLEQGDYKVTITDANGCTITDDAIVKTIEFTVYNAITPNGDGINDRLEFDKIVRGDCTESYLTVFNQWGQIVYESNGNYNNDWGGTDRLNQDLPAGAYFYVFRCGKSGVELEQRSLMIIRN